MSNTQIFKSSGGFDANNQIITNIADAVSLQDALNLRSFNDRNTVPSYSTTRTYPIGYVVEFNGQLWKCTTAVTSTGAFDKTKWKALAGQENWLRITAPYTATSADSILVDTSSGAITITLPAVVSSGDYVMIWDAGSADINAITINRNGQTINGAAANLVINESGTTATLLYLNGTWVLNIIRVPRIKIASGALTAVSNQSYAFDSASSYTVTLPASPKNGDWVEIFDRSGTLGTHTITVSGNSKQIDGLASVALDQKDGGWIFTYNGTSWASNAHFGNGLQADNNLSELTDKAAARTALMLGSLATMHTGTAAGEVRTNTQNDSVYQGKDATLTALAALVTAADKLIYATGPNTFGQTNFPPQARTLLAATTQALQQAALGLGNASTKNVGTAAGNLMEVGAFGLGGDHTISTDVNLNNYRTGGLYLTPAAGLVNKPAGWADGRNTLIVSGSATNYTTQLIFNVSSTPAAPNPKAAFRWSQSGTDWAPWYEFVTSNNVGTAAGKDFGTAAGNLMEVGAFGLGTSSLPGPYTADLNTYTTTGTYYVSGAPNQPVSETSVLTVISSSSTGRCIQSLRTVNTLRVFERRMFDSAWGVWQEVLFTSNTGTAVTKDFGTASGNLMEVGAFGLGRTSGGWSAVDLDTLSETQFHHVSSSAPNIPVAVYGVLLHQSAADSAYEHQTFYTITGLQQIFTRRKVAGAWTAWIEVLTQLSMTPAWIPPTLTNGWVEYDAGSYTPGYRKCAGYVELKGLIKGGAIDTIIFTLPVGYRPVEAKALLVMINGTGVGYLRVSPDGAAVLAVRSEATAIAWVSLDNIRIPLN